MAVSGGGLCAWSIAMGDVSNRLVGFRCFWGWCLIDICGVTVIEQSGNGGESLIWAGAIKFGLVNLDYFVD